VILFTSFLTPSPSCSLSFEEATCPSFINLLPSVSASLLLPRPHHL
jgi:hypothetical protein